MGALQAQLLSTTGEHSFQAGWWPGRGVVVARTPTRSPPSALLGGNGTQGDDWKGARAGGRVRRGGVGGVRAACGV